MRRAPSPVIWVGGGVAVFVAFVLAYIGFVRTTTGQTLDDRAMVAAQTYLDADVTRRTAIGFLERLPEACAILALVVLVAAAITRRRIGAPLIAAGSLGGAVLTTQVLKSFLLGRPDLGVSAANVPSFPSGHVTLAAAAMTAVVLLTGPRHRPLVATLGGVFAAAAGVATFILGWHRPADVLGAYLVAGCWGLVGGWLILKREPEWNTWDDGERPPSALWLALPWIPAVVGIGTALVVWYFILRGNETDPALSAWFLVGGSAMIVGSAMAVFGFASALLTHQTQAAR